MGLIKEPLDVDFVVDNRPLTQEEEIIICKFIRADKNKNRILLNDKSKKVFNYGNRISKRKLEFS